MESRQCNMTHYPAKILAEKAKPVDEIDDNIREIVDKMVDIMIENGGIGLAGPQAGIDLRIFIISLDGSRESVKVFINPVVEISGKLVSNEEGCLSVPGVYTNVRRYSNAKVTATDLAGNRFTEDAEGLYARALQHENDHLEGLTIVNKLGGAAKIVHRKQLKRLEKKAKE